jgi:hypothetical protein
VCANLQRRDPLKDNTRMNVPETPDNNEPNSAYPPPDLWALGCSFLASAIPGTIYFLFGPKEWLATTGTFSDHGRLLVFFAVMAGVFFITFRLMTRKGRSAPHSSNG